MKSSIETLIAIIEKLLGPEGCPWDREQTMRSIRSSVLEEACEFIEAIDLEDNFLMVEELGDLLFNVIFFCKLGEKEKRFKFQDVLEEICAKLIRRHPHVFGTAQVQNSEEVLQQWEKIKQNEKGKEARKSVFDGIPKQLPALLRAQKIVKKLKISSSEFFSEANAMDTIEDEESLGRVLMRIVALAQQKGLDAEQALRNHLAHIEYNDRQKSN
jgi:uncharacterized protein YabN with tetrapyrrole methylase and pyrophosphatase domain